MNAARVIAGFAKAQVSAFLGGVVDYSVMILFVQLFHIHYTIAIIAGGIVGAAVNFAINRYWSFYSPEGSYSDPVTVQGMKFIPVCLASIAMKATGTYWLVQAVSLDYRISRLAVDAIISFAFNYQMQKRWVFKKVRNFEKKF